MTYFVYILRTSANTLYIGQTNNLKKRLKEHQNKSRRSAKYVRYFDSFKLVYSEKYPTRKEAMQRELQLKKWSKAKKGSYNCRKLGATEKTLDWPAQLCYRVREEKKLWRF